MPPPAGNAKARRAACQNSRRRIFGVARSLESVSSAAQLAILDEAVRLVPGPILRISEYSGISFGEFRQMGGLPNLLERLRFLL